MRDGGGSERAVPAAFAVLDVSSLALPPQPSSPPGAVCAVSAAGGSARVGSLGGAGLVSASWREEVAVALSQASTSSRSSQNSGAGARVQQSIGSYMTPTTPSVNRSPGT